jgi:hypothetical protein
MGMKLVCTEMNDPNDLALVDETGMVYALVPDRAKGAAICAAVNGRDGLVAALCVLQANLILTRQMHGEDDHLRDELNASIDIARKALAAVGETT